MNGYDNTDNKYNFPIVNMCVCIALLGLFNPIVNMCVCIADAVGIRYGWEDVDEDAVGIR